MLLCHERFIFDQPYVEAACTLNKFELWSSSFVTVQSLAGKFHSHVHPLQLSGLTWTVEHNIHAEYSIPVDEAKSKPFRLPAARVGVHAFIMCQDLAVAHYVSAFQHRSTDFELLLHKKNIYETTRSLDRH